MPLLFGHINFNKFSTPIFYHKMRGWEIVLKSRYYPRNFISAILDIAFSKKF